ncbi:uncharacterized protein LOC113502080 [Trichoplusia ni]|uniref:Uncharacterized protein LOC113502080 n=1 Tax=Trichoplusia ni TaxID=7111 RepID=A0A7E5WFR5_TRINI|nr:uncharacterized protein LOC113502080 [Trichoplusia ni]
MTAKWDTEKTIMFIEEYRHDCLWEPKNNLYKNRDARESAYRKLIELMHLNGIVMTAKDVKNKIRSLRTTFFAELAKIEKSKTTGSGTSNIYTPKLSWFNTMNFLLTSTELRRNEESTTVSINSFVESENTSTDSRENTPARASGSRSSSQTESQSSSNFRQSIRNARYDPIDTALQELRKINKSVESENEFDVFGQNVSLQLQKLPLEYALETQELIMKVLNEQRISGI